jgi:hypothetical protein
MNLFKNFFQKPKSEYVLSEKDLRWNKFIYEICCTESAKLNDTQRTAVLAFLYNAEMNSGGHSGYFDCYPETNPNTLFDALVAVGAPEIADNYREAIAYGEEDEYIKTDDVFGELEPAFLKSLMDYVELHRELIFLEQKSI